MVNNISPEVFKKHILENTVLPGEDSRRFIAYIILLQKYPKLTYWSYDGWSCDALADYQKGIVWKDKEVIDWETKKVLANTDVSFFNCTTEEIIGIWMQLNGETTKTKIRWLNDLKN